MRFLHSRDKSLERVFGGARSALSLLLMVVAIAAGGDYAFAQRGGAPPSAVKTSRTRVRDRVFNSKAMAASMHYRVLLPANYFTSVRRYPVLYLLHGWHGEYSNFETLTHLYSYAQDLQMIIVMPGAGDSWYVNSATSPQNRVEDYILQDLIGDVDLHWRTLPSGDQRAIAGLSMGGYGALKFALKNPGMFRIAASLSGAFNASGDLAELRADLAESLVRAYGPSDSATRQDNDLYAIASAVLPAKASYLYLNCGSGDPFFLDPNRKLVQTLSARGIAYEYHEYTGEHTWEYWDAQFPSLLSAVTHAFATKRLEF